MRPSSRQIIECIVAAIDDVILPQVSEKQAASSLRAARTLLAHLACRVDTELAVLLDDNRDAEATIAQAAAIAPGRIAAATGEAPAERASLEALEARNASLQAAIETALRGLPLPGRESDAEASLRTELRAYLGRRQARERDMVFPAFLGPPF